MIADHPDFWTKDELESTRDAMVEDEQQQPSDGDEEQNDQPEAIARNWRDVPLDAQTRSVQSQGAAITVAMVAVALGFTCCENLVYVHLYAEHTVGISEFQNMASFPWISCPVPYGHQERPFLVSHTSFTTMCCLFVRWVMFLRAS